MELQMNLRNLKKNQLPKITFILITYFMLFACGSEKKDGVTSASTTAKNPPSIQIPNGWMVPGKKVLVVYFSQGENTKRVANDLSLLLNGRVETILPIEGDGGASAAAMEKPVAIKPLTVKISDYDLIVVGTPVWAWKMAPPVREFLNTYKSQIKQVAFFTVAGGTKPDKITASMERLSGLKSIAITGINEPELKAEGKNRYETLLYTFGREIAAAK